MKLFAVLLLAGCGRIGFGQTASDATPDAVPLGPWTTGTPIPGANMAGANEQDLGGANSKLELYYSRGNDLYSMRRAAVDEPWGPPVLSSALSLGGTNEGGSRLSFDDLTIYINTDRAGGLGLSDVWVATRSAPDQPWGTPVPFAEVNTPMYDKWFSACRDGRYLIVRTLAGNDEIFEGTLGGPPATIVPYLNSTMDDTAVFMTEDCSTMYFSSNRNPNQDIFTAQRQSDGTWGGLRVFDEVTVMGRNEVDPWLSADGHLFLFAANTTGSMDVHEVVR